jgi:PAS domain S-box-containing protein
MWGSKPARVVIIGDERVNRGALASVLREAGHEVREVRTGRAGIALVTGERTDLVVLGVKLPDRNGLELCHEIKTFPRATAVPVILVSDAFASARARATALQAGADACLAEPVEANELLAQVSSLLRLREVEAALRESEERFRLATEAMDGLVYEWHVSGGTTRRSVGLAKFLGWRPEEVPTHSDWWPEQIHPEDAPAVHRHFGEAVASGAQDFRLEYRIRHKDGHYLWIWDSNRIVYDEEGKPTRVIGCAVSIDERKRAEEELRLAKEALARANQHLESQVEERTGKLLEMVAELESWSYGMAHDMRAPLRALHSFSYFLLEDYGPRLDSVAQDYLQRIDAAARRLDDYLGDLLRYGKVGRGELPLAGVDTMALLGEILATYPKLQPPQCTVELMSPLPTVQANASALTAVLSNLLDNAVKFVKKGTAPQVRIWAEEKKPWVRLWVEDNSIGIEKQAQRRLFGLFQRLQPASDYEGTGIGLAIVRRAVERMGGSVGVESEPDGGSRFWVELKAA